MQIRNTTIERLTAQEGLLKVELEHEREEMAAQANQRRDRIIARDLGKLVIKMVGQLCKCEMMSFWRAFYKR